MSKDIFPCYNMTTLFANWLAVVMVIFTLNLNRNFLCVLNVIYVQVSTQRCNLSLLTVDFSCVKNDFGGLCMTKC